MNTSIWAADIKLGDSEKSITIKNVAIKRLPIEILISQYSFIQSLQSKLGYNFAQRQKEWEKLSKDKLTNLPMIKVTYLKYLGDVAQEPIIEYI